MKKLEWTTKSGEVINLYELKDMNHLSNIIKMVKRKIASMPILDLEISGSDSDGAYAADMCIMRDHAEYHSIRRGMVNFLKEANSILKNEQAVH